MTSLRMDLTRQAFLAALPEIREPGMPWAEERVWLQRVVQYAAGRCSFVEAARLLRRWRP